MTWPWSEPVGDHGETWAYDSEPSTPNVPDHKDPETVGEILGPRGEVISTVRKQDRPIGFR